MGCGGVGGSTFPHVINGSSGTATQHRHRLQFHQSRHGSCRVSSASLGTRDGLNAPCAGSGGAALQVGGCLGDTNRCRRDLRVRLDPTPRQRARWRSKQLHRRSASTGCLLRARCRVGSWRETIMAMGRSSEAASVSGRGSVARYNFWWALGGLCWGASVVNPGRNSFRRIAKFSALSRRLF